MEKEPIMDKREIKKNKIIENSIMLMYLNGYNGTSIKDITDAAGVPKGSFYQYFKDKSDYAVEAIKYYYRDSEDSIALFHDENIKPLDRIVRFFETKKTKFKNIGLLYGCFVGNLSEEVGGIDENITFEAENFHNKIEANIYECLKKAKEEGQFASNVDEKYFAKFILTAWQGTLLRSKVSDDFDTIESFFVVLKGLLK